MRGSDKRHRKAAAAALGGLFAVYLLLAALPAHPGSRLVPAAGADAPGWLLGPLSVFGTELATGDGAPLIFYLGLWVAFLLYIFVAFSSQHLPRRPTLLLLGALIAVYALAPPLLSQDVFSYISYARLDRLAGLNPYAHPPSALPGDAAYSYVGWRQETSAYGPIFTLLTYPFAHLGIAGALWGLKAVSALSLAASLALIDRSAKRLGVDRLRAVLFVGFNPLVLVHVVGGAHNDSLMVMVVMAGVWAALAGRGLWTGLSLVAAIAVKVSAVVAAPFTILGSRDRSRAALGALISLLVVAALSTVLFGQRILDSYELVGENQARTSFYSIPNQVARLLEAILGLDAGAALPLTRNLFLIAFAALAVYLVWRTWRDREGWLENAGWAYLGLLLATSWLLPWYAIWLLPFTALASGRRLTVATLCLCAYMLMIRVPL